MLFVHARTNSVVVRFHATLLALIITAGDLESGPRRPDEAPVFVSNTGKLGEVRCDVPGFVLWHFHAV